jgi:hypothetical protein
MGQWFERIPEKDQKIDLASDDLGTDLLITPQWSALEFRDFEAKFLFQYLAGGTCSIHFMVCQEFAVVFGPLHQSPFLIVMRDKGDLLVTFHSDFFVSHMASESFLRSSEPTWAAWRVE